MSHGQDDTVSVPEVGPLDAVGLLDGGAYLLDVREDDEWEAGHALLAHHVSLGELGARLDEIPTDQTIVVCCRSGGRSAMASAALVSRGINAVNLTGGMQAWSAASLPVVDNDGRPGLII